MGIRELKELIETLTDRKCQATSNTKCKTLHTDVVALSVVSPAIGNWWSGGESLIGCVGGLEVSR